MAVRPRRTSLAQERRRASSSPRGRRGHQSRVPRAAEPAEDLPAYRVVPVAERVAHGRAGGSPTTRRAAPCTRCRRTPRSIRDRGTTEARVRREVRRRPLPHVAEHAGGSRGAGAVGIAHRRRGPEVSLAEVRVRRVGGFVVPTGLGASDARAPTAAFSPFRFGGQAPARTRRSVGSYATCCTGSSGRARDGTVAMDNPHDPACLATRSRVSISSPGAMPSPPRPVPRVVVAAVVR